jgi:cobalt-zinc-cadmium efflux system protein
LLSAANATVTAMHAHGRLDARRALAVALTLVLGFAAVEVVAGVLSGSLALLADAGHMLSDALALGLALFAAWLARRPATPERSFGWRRAEILAALANAVTLVVLGLWIVIEAVRRLGDPPVVDGGWVLVAGTAGLVVNVTAARLLHRAGGGLNVRAALMHVLADLAASVGVIVSALVLLLTGWNGADALAGLLIGLLVLAGTVGILRESVGILLEGVPRGIDPRAVGAAMRAASGVVDVHDLHIWTITSGFPALSAHVLVEPKADCHAIRRELEQVLESRFALTHTTLQVEHAPGLISIVS